MEIDKKLIDKLKELGCPYKIDDIQGVIRLLIGQGYALKKERDKVIGQYKLLYKLVKKHYPKTIGSYETHNTSTQFYFIL